MAIQRGQDWGRRGGLGTDDPIVADDAAVRELVERSRRADPGARLPTVGLAGGDLCRTLGGPGGDPGRLRGDGAVLADVDVVRVALDGRDHWFVAHLVARRHGWRDRFLLAMNAEWLGPLKAAPRAHPGDGLIDVIDGALPWRQRLRARRLARTGDHLPHPALATPRVDRLDVAFDRPLDVWLDGVRVGRAATLALAVEPDALTVAV